MRILIISTPRSGSTTLLNWLAYCLKLRTINEPFNENLENRKILQFEFNNEINLLAKIAPNEYEHTKKEKWDYIIGLTRQSTLDCATSFTVAKKMFKTNREWHQPYILEEKWILENKRDIDENITIIERFNHMVLNNFDIDLQITYEGLYYDKKDLEKICKIFNIKKNKRLNYNNKYRIDKPDTTFLI